VGSGTRWNAERSLNYEQTSKRSTDVHQAPSKSGCSTRTTSKALNREARAVGAFAFSLNGVGTQSVSQNDAAGHVYHEMSQQGDFDNAADRWVQGEPVTKKCRCEMQAGLNLLGPLSA
jgi:hypothetical protein